MHMTGIAYHQMGLSIMGHLVMQKQMLAADCATTFVAHAVAATQEAVGHHANPRHGSWYLLAVPQLRFTCTCVQQAFTHQPQKSCLKPSDVWM